jgi:hypothetical protein
MSWIASVVLLRARRGGMKYLGILPVNENNPQAIVGSCSALLSPAGTPCWHGSGSDEVV